MKSTIRLSNQEFQLDEIKSFVTPSVLAFVAEYLSDPNCDPALWVCSIKNELTQNEQTAFIAIANINRTCQRLYDQYNWGGLSGEQHDIWNERKLQYNYFTGQKVPLVYNCPA